MCPSGGESPERPAEPQTDIVGPQRPRSEADEGAKGVMMVDSRPHQPHTKKKAVTTQAGTEIVLILAVNSLAVKLDCATASKSV